MKTINTLTLLTATLMMAQPTFAANFDCYGKFEDIQVSLVSKNLSKQEDHHKTIYLVEIKQKDNTPMYFTGPYSHQTEASPFSIVDFNFKELPDSGLAIWSIPTGKSCHPNPRMDDCFASRLPAQKTYIGELTLNNQVIELVCE